MSLSITSIEPLRVVERGRVTLHGSGFPIDALPTVTIGDVVARVSFASSRRLVVNAPSMAFGPDGHLYVSSRFEGAVYRVDSAGTHETVATDLGVACGIAFDADASMFVGDRSGTIFHVRDGRA